MNSSYRQKKIREPESDVENSDSDLSIQLNPINDNFNNVSQKANFFNKSTFHNNEKLRNRKQIVIDESDVIIVSPIRANNLKLSQVCTDCKQSSSIKRDCDLYAGIIQFCLTSFVSGLIYTNYYVINKHFRQCNHCEHYILEKCHFTLILSTILLINLLTGILLAYDLFQFKRAGKRLSSWFVAFLMWSGGWIVVYILLFVSKLTDKTKCLVIKYGFLITLFSFTSPAFYFISKSF